MNKVYKPPGKRKYIYILKNWISPKNNVIKALQG